MKLGWQQIPSPVVSEILCNEFDGVVLDTEHGCYNNETIYSCNQVIKLSGKKSFVRLTEVNKTLIRYCLDSGVDGLIFSTVENVSQCEKIIEYSFYPPLGKRGLGLVRQNGWGEKKLLANPPIIVAQIETKQAIDNLDLIKNYNFDFYLIGPYDLSLSLGDPGNFDSIDFSLHISKFNDIIEKSKRAVHIPKDIHKNIKNYKNYGLMCLGMDTISILEYHREIKNVGF